MMYRLPVIDEFPPKEQQKMFIPTPDAPASFWHGHPSEL
jgi:hypothetical protein